jgi:hypothetical protein
MSTRVGTCDFQHYPVPAPAVSASGVHAGRVRTPALERKRASFTAGHRAGATTAAFGRLNAMACAAHAVAAVEIH